MSGIFETLINEVQQLRKEVGELRQLSEAGRDGLLAAANYAANLESQKRHSTKSTPITPASSALGHSSKSAVRPSKPSCDD